MILMCNAVKWKKFNSIELYKSGTKRCSIVVLNPVTKNDRAIDIYD